MTLIPSDVEERRALSLVCWPDASVTSFIMRGTEGDIHCILHASHETRPIAARYIGMSLVVWWVFVNREGGGRVVCGEVRVATDYDGARHAFDGTIVSFPSVLIREMVQEVGYITYGDDMGLQKKLRSSTIQDAACINAKLSSRTTQNTSW